MAETETGSIELHVLPASTVQRPGAVVPPARSRTTGDLRTLSSQAGRTLVHAGVAFQAATDLACAWERLCAADMGRTIVSRLGTGQMDPQLESLFGQPWEILEVTAMSLGFGETMSAIDLCADAVLLASGEPLLASGRFYDLSVLRKRQRQLVGPPALRTWIDQLLAHPDLAGLQECRDHLTHRTVRRHITMRLDRRGMPTGRELAEITTLHGRDPARWRGSIAELVPRMVGFGEEQMEALCRAILTPSGLW